MKKIITIVLAAGIPALSPAGQWDEYPLSLPIRFETVSRIAVNSAGIGYAIVSGRYELNGPLLKLEDGEWQILEPPPTNMVYPSITSDGTLYAMDSGASGNIWRYSMSGSWHKVATPGGIEVVKFTGVAGVGPDEFWGSGSSRDARAIVAYYRDGGAARVYDLGRYRTSPNFPPLIHIVAPRAENPGAEAYVALQTLENQIWPSVWLLAVLKPDRGYSFYPIPRGDEDYHVEGLVAYRPGEVRVGMVKNGAAGPTYIYAFENGQFRELAYYVERVIPKCYVTPSDGWGTSYTNKVYHWTTAGPGEFYTLSGVVKDLGMVDVNDGWACGSKEMPGGATKGIIWRYTGNPAVTPASLGRVKAMFR